MNTVPRAMPMLVPAMLLLAACAPATPDASTAPTSAAATASVATPPPVERTPASPSPTASASVAESIESSPSQASPSQASISGAIREGNRAPPALRVCATPVDGGTPTCIETPQGAREYRIDVAPGRYYLLGWVQAGELKLIAHASQIRCIRAPCPPDELIEITVAAGQHRDGVDLNGGYIQIPAGWPQPTH